MILAVAKITPIIKDLIELLWAHRENKRLKEENTSLKRQVKRYELETRGRSVKQKVKK